MINLKTMLNKSPSHISEMLIQGSTMGIIDMTKKLKEYNNVKGYVLSIANELLTFERNSIEEYKNIFNRLFNSNIYLFNIVKELINY